MKADPARKYNRDPTKQSYMERSFEDWLIKNGMSFGRGGYIPEVKVYNKSTKKYGKLDFLFPRKRLIVELDGTHHESLERTHLDNIRDQSLIKRGWMIFRIKYRDYLRQRHVPSLSQILFS